MKILAVDDEREVLNLIVWVLHRSKLNYEVHCATNGADALVCLGLQLFDLCVTDLVMHGKPQMNYLADLRTAHSDLPVVVQTALDDDRTDAVRKDPKMRLLLKPWSPQELVATVNEITAKKSAGSG